MHSALRAAIAAIPYELHVLYLPRHCPAAGAHHQHQRTLYNKWQGRAMIRWLVVVFIVLILLNFFAPFLDKIGYGRLPGDFRFRLFGRPFFLPVATTVLISLVAAALVRIL